MAKDVGVMKDEVFLDANFAIAAAVPEDAHHERAALLTRQISAAQTSIVTTQAVLLEIGNSLSGQKFRTAAVRLLTSLSADPSVEIVPLSDELYVAGIALFRDRSDKEWGLVDCISFEVMRRRGILDALTADQHFEQAGFRALLRLP